MLDMADSRMAEICHSETFESFYCISTSHARANAVIWEKVSKLSERVGGPVEIRTMR